MMGGVLEHLHSSAWYYLTPVVAACAPIGVLRTYFNHHVRRPVRCLLPFLDPFVTVDIAAADSSAYSYIYHRDKAKSSDAYAEVLGYLSEVCSREARELCAEGAEEGHGFLLSLRQGQEVADEFKGVTMWWSAVAGNNKNAYEPDKCCRLTFHERHRRLVVEDYLPYVRRTGQEVTFSNRPRRLYSNKADITYVSSREDVWSYIEFNRPTTFETLAMDPAKKKMIMDDLDDFCNSRDYYSRIGKAWKRGYLLYGPPGTGKSTMIAAMANYLNYDIYDIELTTLRTNSDLRKLFIETTGKSIVVIEDIDCSLDLTGSRGNKPPPPPRRRQQDAGSNNMVTLSGLLNFTDGLWSAHSGERIIVFTTNYVHQLDPALIRRGRMDMHIEMSYCKFEAFKTLASNYLGLDRVDDAHPMFDSIKELLQVVEIAPADVAECLMASTRKERDADTCLQPLLDELENRAKKKKASEAEKEREGGRARKQGQDKEGGQGRRPLVKN